MKEYCVVYNVTTSFDTMIRAKNREEAIAKVQEVIGEDIVIENTWEVNRALNKKTHR